MRFMLVTWSGGGNSTPTFGLAQALLQQGHEVIILGSDRVRDRAAAIGAGFRPYLSASEPSIMEGVFEEVIFDWAMFACGAELANDVLIQLDDVPDALIVDIMLPAALAAAEKSGLPTAVLGHLLYQGFREGPSAHQWDPVLPLIDTTRSALGCASPRVVGF